MCAWVCVGVWVCGCVRRVERGAEYEEEYGEEVRGRVCVCLCVCPGVWVRVLVCACVGVYTSEVHPSANYS